MAYDPANAFARILRGEAPCERLCEDAHTLAFMDIMPQSPGHALIVPKEAAVTIFELSADAAAACMRTTQRVAAAVQRAFDAPGVLIAQVNGEAAGQTVPHVHFHVIPRRAGERLLMHAALRADAAQLAEHAARIRRWL